MGTDTGLEVEVRDVGVPPKPNPRRTLVCLAGPGPGPDRKGPEDQGRTGRVAQPGQEQNESSPLRGERSVDPEPTRSRRTDGAE